MEETLSFKGIRIVCHSLDCLQIMKLLCLLIYSTMIVNMWFIFDRLSSALKLYRPSYTDDDIKGEIENLKEEKKKFVKRNVPIFLEQWKNLLKRDGYIFVVCVLMLIREMTGIHLVSTLSACKFRKGYAYFIYENAG